MPGGFMTTVHAAAPQLRSGPIRRRHALALALALAEPEGLGHGLQTRVPASQRLAALTWPN
jgi:hypothetical protein